MLEESSEHQGHLHQLHPITSSTKLKASNLSWLSDPFLLKATIIVGSGGLIFGYDIGVISGTLSTLESTFALSSYEEGLVVSILYAGSIAGCIFGGPLCDHIGRWKTIQIQNTIFIVGALVTGLALNKFSLYLGRFLVGIASSISGLADVPYLTEIAPAEFRGILSGQYEILVAFGILISFALDVYFASFSNGWRIAFLVPGIFALFQSIAMLWLPESPKWLLSKNHTVEARTALEYIYTESRLSQWKQQHYRSYQNKDNRFDDMLIPDDVVILFIAEEHQESSSVPRNVSVSSTVPTASPCTNIIKYQFFGTEEERIIMSNYIYPITLVILFQIFSQVTGSNVVRNYAAVIFESNGASKQVSLVLNVVLGIVKWISTVIAVWFVEEHGRRILFLGGAGLVTIGMFILTIASLTSAEYTLHNVMIFILGCVMIYAGFGFGYGPIPWILSSEMIPTTIRGRIMSWTLIASNVAQLVTNFMFLPMTQAWTTSGSFGLFTILNIITWVFVYLFLCETKDVLPLEIKQRLYMQYMDVRRSYLHKIQGNFLSHYKTVEHERIDTVEDEHQHQEVYGAVFHSAITNSNNEKDHQRSDMTPETS